MCVVVYVFTPELPLLRCAALLCFDTNDAFLFDELSSPSTIISFNQTDLPKAAGGHAGLAEQSGKIKVGHSLREVSGKVVVGLSFNEVVAVLRGSTMRPLILRFAIPH